MSNLKTVAIQVTIFLMFLNATPALLVGSGVADDLGINPNVGADDRITDANQAAQNDIKATGGFSNTLFGLFTSVTGPVKTILMIFFGGPIMLANAGLPGWLIDFVFVPQYVIVGATIIYVLAGRRL